MLQTLRIQNYALIDEVELEFDPGLNVLTGETGAGKSIIVGALMLVLGGRASSEAIRSGTRSAKIEALFRVASPTPRLQELLESHAIELEEGELLLSRVLSPEGRSKAYANGSLIPVSVQSAIGDELLDLHGQHEHQSLLKTDRQLALLDSFAGLDSKREILAELVRALRELEARIAGLESNDREQARQIDFMRFEAEEIEKADLRPGEEAELKSRRNLIANAEKIFSLASNARRLLSESGESSAALDTLGAAVGNLEELAAIDERFGPMAAQARNAMAEVEALSSELFQYTEETDYDPRELDAVNGRLSTIQALQRKYGDTIEEVLAYRDRIVSEIEAFENRDRDLEELRCKHGELLTKAKNQARALSKRRKSAAAELDAKITASLQDLGIEGGRLEIDIQDAELNPSGMDQIAFMLTANPGEPPKALRQVASGGELSRIMLALKGVFADADRIPTLVFDEIDAGIGGPVATKVAFRLRDLARSHQTICITHLPQIAAAGFTHYHVSKTTRNGKTSTHVSRIDRGSRVEEVARLLDGSVTEVSLTHARALLKDLA
ncbi:MAG: DNA repair protein RecN [Candidatus Hydrogenedentes bacterium]|nr:DNA repair protein RecN [Candidatus Hydrogenedentota bacterium]